MALSRPVLRCRLPRTAGIPPLRRPFHRTLATEEQLQSASLQKTPHTPNQIVTEVPHSKEPSIIDVPSPLWFHRLGPVRDFFSGFSRLQRRRPLTMTLVTSLTTYFLGDVIAQEIGGETYDPWRTARMLIVGSVACIPGYKWFVFLGSHFNYNSRLLSITTKVAIQQFFFAPIFNTYFFGMQAILAGHPPSVVISRVWQAVPESVISSAKFWPAVTAVNFTVIPAHFRFLFSGFFAVIWQTYLSFLNRKEEKVGPRDTLREEGIRDLFEESRTTTEEMKAGLETTVNEVAEVAKEVIKSATER